MAELELAGIEKRYKGKTVLRGASMTAEAGSCVGVLGRNGSGKSTLLNILAGVLAPDGGRFLWHGEDLLAAPRKRRKAVGYVPQGTPLFEELTALDNLKLWYDRASLERELAEGGILKLLDVDAFLRVRVSKLSGGMKKRLSIGCAMASRPEILLLDEASTALDLPCKAELMEYLKNLRAAGTTLLMATHDLQEAAECDRLYLLSGGKLSACAFDGDLGRLMEYFK